MGFLYKIGTRRKRRLSYFGWLLLLMLGAGQWSAAGARAFQDARITVRDTAVINSNKIYLVDIADIEAPPLLKEQLETICLGYSPRLGEVKTFDGKRLKVRILSEIPGSGEPAVSVPETVLIKRECQKISTEEIQGVFKDYVTARAGQKEFQVRDLTLRGPDLFPGGNLSMRLSSNSEDIKGRVTLYLDVFVNGEACGRLSAAAWVDLFDGVLCASRYLERGTILSQGDITTERVNISRIPDNYLNDAASVLGKALRTGTREGSHIRENMLEEPPLVRKGEVVRLVAMTGNVQIVTTGIARGDGKMNDQIQVSNMNSDAVVHGIVTGPTRVKVVY